MSVCLIPPHIPLLYSKTGVKWGIHYFLIFALKHRWGVYVLSKNKKIIIFLSKMFHLYCRENRCTLHGHVFEMICIGQNSHIFIYLFVIDQL